MNIYCECITYGVGTVVDLIWILHLSHVYIAHMYIQWKLITFQAEHYEKVAFSCRELEFKNMHYILN